MFRLAIFAFILCPYLTFSLTSSSRLQADLTLDKQVPAQAQADPAAQPQPQFQWPQFAYPQAAAPQAGAPQVAAPAPAFPFAQPQPAQPAVDFTKMFQDQQNAYHDQQEAAKRAAAAEKQKIKNEVNGAVMDVGRQIVTELDKNGIHPWMPIR
eukprot:gnl/MRDRNA2_/MRDRNA2_92255_c0_seq1.p1 gnl/MRDRNA2_/MRDRNA2_92255_c0~~gnl/MRDRNA2_/MRDRNA2_92255_c0_seq1.p1  ORF type:complete len:153 (+),score=43.22 gnl/MRDRNA2_/MRDRNA2_92255_c0_seq1:95-553(+)